MKAKSSQRVDYILEACRGKRVLHVGCSDTPYTKTRLDNGTLLHGMIEEVAAVQYGIDLSQEGIDMLAAAGFRNLAVANVEELASNNPFGDVEFDVIVAGEILEHLCNPGMFLDGMRPLFKNPQCKLLLTTINAYCAYRFVYSLLMGGENVHPDHTYYFSKSTLTGLLKRHGYEVQDFSFYPVGRDHQQTLKQGRAWVMWWTDRLAYRFRPQLGDGVMVTCGYPLVEQLAA